jgi:hypothetical protein
MSGFCTYYCAFVAFLAMIFFAVLIVLEKNQNEYLIRNYQTDGDTDSRVKSLLVTIGINFFIFLGLVFMISRQKSEDKEVDGPEWKFAHKIERPTTTIN